VSDSGGGIKHEMLERIWQYGSSTTTYTTPDIGAAESKWSDHYIFGPAQMKYNRTASDSFHGSVIAVNIGIKCFVES